MGETTLDDFLSADEISALFRPTGEAVGLPGRVYGPAFYELEQRTLFPRTWCAVGFASDIPRPGDAVPVELAGWPLILLRGGDGCIRAFHNVCRHRAMRVLTAPVRGCSALVCPWHAWTYDLSGKLVATPRIGGERANTDTDFEPGAAALAPVRVGRFLDLVFVNLDGRAPAFDDHIAPLANLVDDLDLADMRRGEEWSLVYPGNWKVAFEGAVEDYHIPWGHPQLVRGARTYNAGVAAAGRTFMATSAAREFTASATAAMGLDSDLPPIPRRRERAQTRTYFIGIFPTGACQTRPNHILLGLLLPDGAERTSLRFAHYYAGDGATDPARAATRAALVADWKLVFEQDIPFVRQVHENHRLRDAAGIETRFAPAWESSVQRFQQAVIEVLRGDPAPRRDAGTG